MMLMRVVLAVSAFGLAASTAAHISTFMGFNPDRQLHAVWLLHLLIFVIVIPMLIWQYRDRDSNNGGGMWKTLLEGKPLWVKVLCGGMVAYTIFNFFYVTFGLLEGGVPEIVDGQKVLTHAKTLRYLTDAEFEQYRAWVVRGFSGHWMFFYGAFVMTTHWRMGRVASSVKKAARQADGHWINGV